MEKSARERLQLNVELTPDLAKKLDKHIDRARKANGDAVVKKADVVREILSKGMAAMDAAR
jgi:hypothetical protein